MSREKLTDAQQKSFNQFLAQYNDALAIIFKKHQLPDGNVKNILEIIQDYFSSSNFAIHNEDGIFTSKTTPISFFEHIFSLPWFQIGLITITNVFFLAQLGPRIRHLIQSGVDDAFTFLHELGCDIHDLHILYQDGVLDEGLDFLEKSFLKINNNPHAFEFLTTPQMLYFIIIQLHLNLERFKNNLEILTIYENLKKFIFLNNVTTHDLRFGARHIPQEKLDQLKDFINSDYLRIIIQSTLALYARTIILMKTKSLIYFDIEQNRINSKMEILQPDLMRQFVHSIPQKITAFMQRFKVFQIVSLNYSNTLVKSLKGAALRNELTEDSTSIESSALWPSFYQPIDEQFLKNKFNEALMEMIENQMHTRLIDNHLKIVKDPQEQLKIFTDFSKILIPELNKFYKLAEVLNINQNKIMQTYYSQTQEFFTKLLNSTFDDHLTLPLQQEKHHTSRQKIISQFLKQYPKYYADLVVLAKLSQITEGDLKYLQVQVVLSMIHKLFRYFFLHTHPMPHNFNQLSLLQKKTYAFEAEHQIIVMTNELKEVLVLAGLSVASVIKLINTQAPYRTVLTTVLPNVDLYTISEEDLVSELAKINTTADPAWTPLRSVAQSPNHNPTQNPQNATPTTTAKQNYVKIN